jgi:hypothetical protein
MKNCQVVIFVCLLLGLPTATWAQFTFITNNGAITITAFEATNSSVVIPSIINGLQVTTIGPSAFYRFTSVTSVTIPASITNIGDYAFQETGLSTVSIPASVIGIGVAPFEQCADLTEINVDPANSAYASLNGVLFNQKQTVLIQYPGGNPAASYTIPATVTDLATSAFANGVNPGTVIIGPNVASIGDEAFYEARVSSLSLTNGLVSIGNQAFYDTPLNNLVIPATVTNLGDEAFTSCSSLSRITVAPANAYYSSVSNVLFDANQTTLIQYPAFGVRSYAIPDSVTNVADGAFFYATLTNLTFGTKVQRIGSSALYGCSYVLKLTLDPNLVTIGDSAFVALNLTSITLPASVTSIGDYAFQECENMPAITIPAMVTNFGSCVFQSCFDLTNILVDPQNPSFSSVGGVMFDKTRTTLVEYPEGTKGAAYTISNGVTRIGNGAFVICQNLTNIVIPGSVTSIGTNAFFGCSRLASFSLPNTVTSLGDRAFEDCFGLASIALGTGITNIPDYCFLGCNELYSVTLPGSVTRIGDYAFFEDRLIQLTLPPNLTRIGVLAFGADYSLTSVTIPASVTSLGDGAFGDCSRLTNVFFVGDAPSADATVFEDDPGTVFHIPGTTGWTDSFGGLPTSQWTLTGPLIRSSSAAMQGNQFGFTIVWATNLPVVVEACTNLTKPAWQPVQTNSLNNGTCDFIDPQGANHPARYYRVRSP